MNVIQMETVRNEVVNAYMTQCCCGGELEPDDMLDSLAQYKELRDKSLFDLTSEQCSDLMVLIDDFVSFTKPSFDCVDLYKEVSMVKSYKDACQDYAFLLNDMLMHGDYDHNVNWRDDFIPFEICVYTLMAKHDPLYWTDDQKQHWQTLVDDRDCIHANTLTVEWVKDRMAIEHYADDYYQKQQHSQNQMWCMMQMMQTDNRMLAQEFDKDEHDLTAIDYWARKLNIIVTLDETCVARLQLHQDTCIDTDHILKIMRGLQSQIEY